MRRNRHGYSRVQVVGRAHEWANGAGGRGALWERTSRNVLNAYEARRNGRMERFKSTRHGQLSRAGRVDNAGTSGRAHINPAKKFNCKWKKSGSVRPAHASCLRGPGVSVKAFARRERSRAPLDDLSRLLCGEERRN